VAKEGRILLTEKSIVMKKILLLSVLLLIVFTANAQTQFSVPTPTLDEKFNTTKRLMNNTMLALISVAKSDWMTIEELGKKTGELAFPYWDENSEYEQLVNFTLNSWACMADSVKIIEQSNEKIVITLSSMYRPLENQGVMFSTSVEDYTAFFNALMSAIAVHLGYSFEMTREEEGYKIVITQ
jgi:hypothetical protein